MNDNTTPHTSSEYDTDVIKTIPYYDNFHNETIDLINNYPGRKTTWLDLGAGTGTLIEKAIKIFKDTKFILCDPSANMLNSAKTKLGLNENISYISNCKSQEIDKFVTDKVDIITAIQSNHYLSKTDRIVATQNSYNLLNHDGIYITFENIMPLSNTGISVGLERWTNFQLNQGRDIKAVENHKSRFNTEYFPISILEHLDVLKNAGFSQYEIFWVSNMQAGFYAIK